MIRLSYLYSQPLVPHFKLFTPTCDLATEVSHILLYSTPRFSDILPSLCPMVLLSKLCLLQNRISKIELIQIILIPESRDFSKTITVCTLSPLRHVSSHPSSTILTYPVVGYTTLRRVAYHQKPCTSYPVNH